jgi:hypothetical protein
MIKAFSNPALAAKNAQKYLGKNTQLFLSTKKDKKYMVLDPNDKLVHFGQMGYEDFTKHKDLKRRDAYLKRATKIKGNWKKNAYSPNNLAINVLWI